jgi:hypothetical protein
MGKIATVPLAKANHMITEIKIFHIVTSSWSHIELKLEEVCKSSLKLSSCHHLAAMGRAATT